MLPPIDWQSNSRNGIIDLPTHLTRGVGSFYFREVAVESLATDTVTVRIPAGLLLRTGNRQTVKVTGRTIREVIEALEHDYPGLLFNLCYETGELRPYVNVFLEQESVRYLQGLDTPVHDGATVHIFHSVAGG